MSSFEVHLSEVLDFGVGNIRKPRVGKTWKKELCGFRVSQELRVCDLAFRILIYSNFVLTVR